VRNYYYLELTGSFLGARRSCVYHVTKKIIEEAIMTTDPDIIGVLSVLDAKDEEN